MGPPCRRVMAPFPRSLGYVRAVRILLVVVTGTAIVLVGWLVAGALFGGGAVTEDEIERAVAQRPRGRVQFVLCNEIFVPSQTPRRSSAHTWTCDTYIGR